MTVRRPSNACWQLLGLALLTHLVYPVVYDGLLGRQGHAMIVVSTVVVMLRNVALVLFTVEVCRFAWRALSPGAAKGSRPEAEALP